MQSTSIAANNRYENFEAVGRSHKSTEETNITILTDLCRVKAHSVNGFGFQTCPGRVLLTFMSWLLLICIEAWISVRRGERKLYFSTVKI